MTLEEKRTLYRDSCAVVRHMARCIENHFATVVLLADSGDEFVVDATMHTAVNFAEGIGNLMNNHDMIDADEDEWTYEVFERMQKWSAQSR